MNGSKGRFDELHNLHGNGQMLIGIRIALGHAA
jgi:hypothetical protein